MEFILFLCQRFKTKTFFFMVPLVADIHICLKFKDILEQNVDNFSSICLQMVCFYLIKALLDKYTLLRNKNL